MQTIETLDANVTSVASVYGEKMLRCSKLSRTFALGWLLFVPHAPAGLLVAPTRIELTQEEPVTTVALRHIGNKPGRYRISGTFYRMLPDGTLEESRDVKDSDRSAMKFVRFSPREVTLAPNVEQVGRVMVAPPGKLPDGEYRMHLLFEPTEDTEGEWVGKSGGQKPGSIGMQLEAKMSVAIPVYFRKGTVTSQVSLADLQLVKMATGTLGYSLNLLSSGSAFPHGDFYAIFVNGSGKEVQVGVTKSISSYLNERKVMLPLAIPEGVKFAQGLLRIEFREPEKGGTLGRVLETIEGRIP